MATQGMMTYSAAPPVDRFLPIARALSDPVRITGGIGDALTLDTSFRQ